MGVHRLVAVLTLLCVAAPAAAQTAAPASAPKPKAAAPAKPAATATRATGAAALPLSERIAIQNDLIWTGDLISIADGEWGARSTAAVKSFQKRKGGKETGVLTAEERATLTAEARMRQDEVGWRIVTDDSGIRLGIPAKLVPQARKGRTGGSWRAARGDLEIEVFREPSPATLTAIYEQQRRTPSRKITYSVVKPGFFVISGPQGSKRFYMRVHAGPNEVRGVTMVYDPAMGELAEILVVAVSSGFTPFPASLLVTGRSVEKRKVEYASGVVVSAAGDIVTDREALEGCQVIVVNGFGNAERVADDRNSGLALVRVYGAHGLKPLALGDAIRSDVTLVGVPDPQSQAGRASVTTAKAKAMVVGDGATLDAAPGPGFAGAAAMDAEAGLVGVIVQKPQVVAGPATGNNAPALASAEAIRRLLAVQNVTPGRGAAGVEAARDAVVRIICVRK